MSWRNTCVSSTLLKRPTWNTNVPQDFEEVFFSKNSSVLTGEEEFYTPASNTYGFLSRDTWVSST
jgi:hypothetical protein